MHAAEHIYLIPVRVNAPGPETTQSSAADAKRMITAAKRI